jgi:hypothetical protein
MVSYHSIIPLIYFHIMYVLSLLLSNALSWECLFTNLDQSHLKTCLAFRRDTILTKWWCRIKCYILLLQEGKASHVYQGEELPNILLIIWEVTEVAQSGRMTLLLKLIVYRVVGLSRGSIGFGLLECYLPNRPY